MTKKVHPKQRKKKIHFLVELRKATDEIQKVATLINDRKREAENFQVLLEIYNQLTPPVEVSKNAIFFV